MSMERKAREWTKKIKWKKITWKYDDISLESISHANIHFGVKKLSDSLKIGTGTDFTLLGNFALVIHSTVNKLYAFK